MRKIFFALFYMFLVSCGTVNSPFYSDAALDWKDKNSTSNSKIVHTLFLIGDAGEIHNESSGENFVLNALSTDIKNTITETSLVYLGDNVYPVGLPKKKSPERALGEQILDAQLALAQDVNGKTYFIPGNHDWNKHKKGGLKAIKRQEEYIQEHGGKHVKFYPNDGCGDPKVVKINKDLVYVFLDTQWWLQDWSKEKKINRGCDIKSRYDLLESMQEIFTDHKNDEIIVMMHHPIKSNGMHGGNFTLKHHIFPLHELGVWFPLPVIGSVYPIYRNITGSPQDITNAHNQELMQGLDNMAKRMRINVVFAAGHEHGLQYFDGGKIKYIVSGAGSKNTYTKQGGNASYARDATGYAKVLLYENSESWVEYYTVSGFGQKATLEFRAMLRAPRAGTIQEEIIYPTITKLDTTFAANPILAAGPIKNAFLGSQYRDVWAVPVKAEMINLETKLGGLTPIKKGGGQASNSLRMERADGKQFILRSIKKDYRKLVPPQFSDLALLDVMKDQNSASHPYGALIIPRLSKAAGVYYTDPKLVYLKHQRGLGNYNSQFPEELYLLEERPTGDWRDAEQFGNSKEIIGYSDLLDILRVKKNHFVDQEWVLKSRLFDLFIHDWDRHDDQWRWAKFNIDDNHIYRPIPRDRDQAFYRFKGMLPWLISNLSIKQFKTIKKDCKDVRHLAFNAKHFDRYFLHDLEWKEWEPIISKMQQSISDTDIEESINLFPEETKELQHNQELEEILKSRRDNLMEIGKRLYDYLSKEVDISGTDNKDHFLITKLANGQVTVKVSLDTKEHGMLSKYERTFYPSETKEIRLYGLRGKDDFKITGVNNTQISIRIIGGEDNDTVTNQTDSGKITVYDDPEGMDMYGKLSDKRSDDLNVNDYNRNGFLYNTSLPLASFGNTLDDGWWIGGSISWVTQGWRKTPYKASQDFSFSLAPGSRNAFKLGYHGHIPDAIGQLDLAPEAEIDFPHYENFFGLGNNSVYDQDWPLEYNWVRMRDIDINPRLRAHFGSNSRLDFGPLYKYRKILNTNDRVSEDVTLGFSVEEFESRTYFGGDAHFTLGTVDSRLYPTNGFLVNASATHLIESSMDERVTELDLTVKAYIQLINKPQVVFATQLGLGRSYGDLQFYQYQDLGNNRGLRGFRNERFRGTSALYHNMDLRMHMFNWKNRLLPMGVGFVGGYDYGRVSLSDDTDDNWHSSNTIGLSLNILGAINLVPAYSFTEEGDVFSLNFGFSF